MSNSRACLLPTIREATQSALTRPPSAIDSVALPIGGWPPNLRANARPEDVSIDLLLEPTRYLTGAAVAATTADHLNRKTETEIAADPLQHRGQIRRAQLRLARASFAKSMANAACAHE